IDELPIIKVVISETGRERALKRRLEIVEQYVKKLGLGNARTFTKQIAEKYKIGERQVQKDFKWIKGNVKTEDMNQVRLDLKILRDKTLNLSLLNIEAASNPNERNDAIKTAWVVIEKYRQDMEEWGEKDKIENKYDLKLTQPAIFNLIEKSLEEIKNERLANQPKADGNAESTG
ncbi:MAG: hypothetical protein WD876_03930, partial [Candidatus Pacearchaeota archaeon]